MIRYIFCGYMFADIENDIKKMKIPPPVSSHKFQMNLVKGLVENGKDVTVINIPRVRFFPHYPQIVFHKNRFSLDDKKMLDGRSINIGFINLPLINYITHQKNLVKAILSVVKSNPDDLFILVSFNTYLPQNKAMIEIKRKNPNIKICIIVGDLHGSNGVRVAGRYDGLKGKATERIEEKQDELLREYDYFGFLTKYMADVVGVQNKPWTVIEGMYSNDTKSMEKLSSRDDKKIIFYAGAIESEYGLAHLLDSFEMIEDSDYVLEIAGGGGYVETIKEKAIRDNRIKYLGFLTPSEVKEHQANATILVNPRQSTHEYIKYSFPSKNMECLASGKPYVAHKLACNPKEYDQYIQYPVDESDKTFSEKIKEICSLSEEERTEIGRRGREFILNNKTPQKQVKRIIDLINDRLG